MRLTELTLDQLETKLQRMENRRDGNTVRAGYIRHQIKRHHEKLKAETK